MHFSCLVFIAVVLVVKISPIWGAKSLSDILDSLFPDKANSTNVFYDKRIRPNFGKEPLQVTLSGYVLDLFNVDEKKHEFTAQLIFRQKWIDPRLGYEPPPGVSKITLDSEHAKKMWIPDTFLVNERSSLKHDFTVDNEYIRLMPDGEVMRNMRITVTSSCKMNLSWFPFDRHVCSLVFESYGYNSDDFYYIWDKDDKGGPKVGVSAGSGGSINQKVLAVKAYLKSITLRSGSYSRAAVDFIIARVSTRYIQDVYFPSTLLVVAAFITMSVGSIQLRVFTSAICMVAIIIFTSLLSGGMPKVSHQTALDFYVFTCSLMIFSVVLVNFLMYHLQLQGSTNPRMRMSQISDSAENIKEGLPDTDPSLEELDKRPPTFDGRFKELVYKCCVYSQIMTPCFCLVFNVIYWMVVFICSNSVGKDTDFIILENTE